MPSVISVGPHQLGTSPESPVVSAGASEVSVAVVVPDASVATVSGAAVSTGASVLSVAESVPPHAAKNSANTASSDKILMPGRVCFMVFLLFLGELAMPVA
jgi:hypothetical protein